jgi:hypothetical protein
MARRPSNFRIDNPASAVVQSHISYWGTSSGNGNIGGTTLICADLVAQPDFDGHQIVLIDGPYSGQTRDINGITTAGTVTVARAFDGQIVAGTAFAIVSRWNDPTIVDTVMRGLSVVDYWSNFYEEIQLGAVAATLTMPTVTVADLPAGSDIIKVNAIVSYRAVQNIYDGNNALDGDTVAATSQVIQVRSDAPGTWTDAINFVNGSFALITETREGAGAMFGQLNLATEVAANDTYEFRWLLAKSSWNNINFNDIQTGLRIWYR